MKFLDVVDTHQEYTRDGRPLPIITLIDPEFDELLDDLLRISRPFDIWREQDSRAPVRRINVLGINIRRLT